MKSDLMKRHIKMTPLIAVVIAVVVLGIALLIHNQLRYTDTSAGCYGYSCEPRVMIGARDATARKGELQYGSINIGRGGSVLLGWSAVNVDACQAVGGWTDFAGLFYPATAFGQPITATRAFKVTCFKDGLSVASDSVTVKVNSAITPGTTAGDTK